MWKRNLLFLSLCVAGLAALGASLSPVHRLPAQRAAAARVRTASFTGSADDADLTAVVRQIDEAARRQWSAAGLNPTAPAEDLTVARRLSLALTGTIPSLEDIRQLEAQPSDVRTDWWLETLLADRRTYDYLAERLARSLVGVEDGPFLIYRRRRFVAWLTDELAAGRPYDQIARELIESTGLWTDRPATNFVTVTIKPDEGSGPDAKVLAARVSRALLGVRLDCAECHDHPFESWKQSDFEGLAAFFGQTVQTKFTGIQDDPATSYRLEDRKTGELRTIAAGVPFESDLLPADGSLRHRLAGWMTDSRNRQFSRATVNRFWAILFGRPLVEPIDSVSIADDLPPAVDLLAADFASHHYDLRRLIRTIARTRMFRGDSRAGEVDAEITSQHAAAWASFPITRLRPEQVAGAVLQASSLTTIDYESHILIRAIRAASQNEFVQRYGDAGVEEFAPSGGTIPQRLMMMNGKQVLERTKEDILLNAATQIAVLAPTDAKAVETAYLAVLTRRPSGEELRHFSARLADETDPRKRSARLEDLYWTLVNSTETSWNH